MSATTTIAEQIAAELGNDGQRWETEDGRNIDALCEERGGAISYARSEWDEDACENVVREVSAGDINDLRRWAFADGSAIVYSDAAWDIEGAAPFSWAGA